MLSQGVESRLIIARGVFGFIFIVVKKLLAPALGLFILACGVYFVVQFQMGKAVKIGDSDLPMAVVERGDVESTVEVSGDIAPLVETEIKSEISGRIIAIHVREGENVREGQLLVELDDRDLLDEKAAVETEIAIAKLQHDKAQRDFQRAESLHKRDLLSLQQFLDAETAYLLARKSLLRSELKLKNVETRLSRTKIHSPMSGMVLIVNVIVGQVAIGATSVNNGTTLMKVANLNEMVIQTHINQIDIARLRAGMAADFSVDSLPKEKFKAVIRTIAPVATTRNNIKGYAVTLDINTGTDLLKPGMTADVKIPVAAAHDVLTVPVTALFRPEGRRILSQDRMLVFVAPQGALAEPEQREVEVGISNFSRVEIKSGLSENEKVLLVRPPTAGSEATLRQSPGAGRRS